MKYIINKRTKEHRVCTDEYFEDADVWDIVEADEDGWIPWSGGECPLPEFDECEVEKIKSSRGTLGRRVSMMWAWDLPSGHMGRILAYRPILADTSRRHGRTIAFIPPTERNVFDRLHEATAASQSIPAIIKEIDELLAPAGYCVARREAEPAEDMTDWRNWVDGDLLECVWAKSGHLTEGACYTMTDREYGFVFILKDDTGETGLFKHDRFRFHSRPSKERTPCTI